MKRLMILVLCVATMALAACAPQRKIEPLSQAEQAALIPQPLIMAVGGQNVLVHNFNEFGMVMKGQPKAFVTYIREDQYNSAYHLHLRSVFTEMGYTPAEEGWVNITGNWLQKENEQNGQQVETPKKGKKAKKAKAEARRYYKQTYFDGGNPMFNGNGQPVNQNRAPRQQANSSSFGWRDVINYGIPILTIGGTIAAIAATSSR